jgi:hypothetical protein
MKCRELEAHLPDLLLDPESVKPTVREHVEACAGCQGELADLQATMHVLDEWKAPELSPYFDVKMQAKLRAAKEAAPEGFWERFRARMLFSSNVHLRTAGAAALAAVMAIGGGSALYVSQMGSPQPQVQASATVRDLQSLDENAQVFQQLNAVDTDDAGTDASSN